MMEFVKRITPGLIKAIKDDIANDKTRMKTSPTLDNIIHELYEVKGRTSNNLIKKTAQRMIDEVDDDEGKLKQWLNTMEELIHAASPSGDSIEVTMSHIRSLIKKKHGEDSPQYTASLREMKYRDKAAMIAHQRERLKQKHTNEKERITIKASDVFRVIDESKTSKDIHELIVFVQLATGARFIEVVKISKFEPVKDNPCFIHINGVAKKKRKTDADMEFNKPLINSCSDEVIEAVQAIRAAVSPSMTDKTNAEITQSLSSSTQLRAAKLFKGAVGNKKVTTHVLRKIYGVLSYQIFADKEKYSLSGWLNHVLGHAENDLENSLHYSTINLIYDLDNDGKLENPSNNEKSDDEEDNTATEEKKSPPATKKKNYHAIECDGHVEFKDDDGDVITIQKNDRKNDGKQLERMTEAVRVMNGAGIKSTNTNLRKLGYGSRVLGLLKKADRQLII